MYIWCWKPECKWLKTVPFTTINPQDHKNKWSPKIEKLWKGQGLIWHKHLLSEVKMKEILGTKPPWMHWSWVNWIHYWQPQWVSLMGTQMEPFWRGLLNLEPQKYFSIRHTLWMGQDHRLRYQSHMIFFNNAFGIWIGRKIQMEASGQSGCKNYREI